MANNEKDDILFEQLNRNKKRRRRRIVITVVSIVLVVLIAIIIAVSVLSARVRERFASAAADVKNYSASIGRISTTVSGTGVLEAVDTDQIKLPEGVELKELLVSAGDSLQAGDPVASVELSSVMKALSDTQDQLDALDKQIDSAKNDKVSSRLTSSVSGRVKAVFAQKGDHVVDVMTEHGALALISLDGLMETQLEGNLDVGTQVQVTDSGDKNYTGTVAASAGGKMTVTLTDDGAAYGDTVTVSFEDAVVGTGTLAIHNPIAVTGYAGTVSGVSVKENQRVYSGGTVFTLTNTGYSANYDALLQSREEKEQTLNTLLEMLRTGVVAAPFDGVVTLVDWEEDGSSTSLLSGYSVAATASTKNVLCTMAPDEQVCVTVGIDETDILSLKIGQNALVTVSSIEEEDLPGVVTEVTKVGLSASGVTQYSAVVTLDKTERMLTGMTATVDIQIEGVEDAVIIPVDALHQTKTKSFVYTSYDPETKEYGGMVDVVPGVSNSNFVEIVSGLNPGDTVYYTEQMNFGFFMMPMGNSRGNTNAYRNARSSRGG